MKRIYLIISLIPLIASSQYSTYYGTYNTKSTIDLNVNQNVNVTGSVNKTITTIDYGSLALANAEREKTRLQSLQYTNELDRQRALEIAINPMRAFDYGIDNTAEYKGKVAKTYGLTKFKWYHKIPEKSLFVSTNGFSYRNVSDNNIVCEIELRGPTNINGMDNEELKVELNEIYKIAKENIEEHAKYKKYETGVFIKELKGFLHKKEIGKATVYVNNGFRGTLIFEDDYEFIDVM